MGSPLVVPAAPVAAAGSASGAGASPLGPTAKVMNGGEAAGGARER